MADGAEGRLQCCKLGDPHWVLGSTGKCPLTEVNGHAGRIVRLDSDKVRNLQSNMQLPPDSFSPSDISGDGAA